MKRIHIITIFFSTLFISACFSSPSSIQEDKSIKALNGKEFKDKITVNREIPQLAQKAKSHYNICYLKKNDNENKIYIDQFVKPEYKIIKLESNEECMIGQITNVLVDDSLIFVFDSWHNNVFVFNSDGKYKNKIGQKGHARNEYTSITYMSLDKGLKQVCLRDDYSQKLLFYDYQGHFQNCEPMFFWFEGIEIYGDRRITLTLPYPNAEYQELDKFKLTITNNKGRPIYGALTNPGFPKYSLRKSQFRTCLSRPMHTFPDGVYYIDILTPDTIWRINETECDPILTVNFGEPFTTPETYKEMTNDSYLKRINEVLHLRDDFIFTKNFSYVSFGKSAIIDLNTGTNIIGQITRRRESSWQNLFSFSFGLKPYNDIFLFDWYTDQFAKVFYADEVINSIKALRKNNDGEAFYQNWPQADRDFINGLSMEDNPLIIIGTFKKFANEKN